MNWWLVIYTYFCFEFLHFFFYQGFLPRTQTTHRTAGEGRGPSFIPLHHFHPLIQTFICNFACEMNIIFLIASLCIYQAATRWNLPRYRITIWLIDDVTLNFCLFTCDLILAFFCYSNLRLKTGGSELAATITLILQANRLTKCASHPKVCFLSILLFGGNSEVC